MTQPQTYYRDEQDESDVNGILVVRTTPVRSLTDEEKQEIDTEKYGVCVTENRADGWCAPFWMSEQEFTVCTHGDSIEQVGKLPDDKFSRVVDIAKDNT